ncbi:MAG: mechanosensitive ion channel [Cryomorphaceae bacterium]|nr:mechanosensitive ion channel [Cryomorphaceae bacterium]
MVVLSGIDLKTGSGFKSFLEFELLHIGENVSIRVWNIFLILLLFLSARVISWTVRKYITAQARKKNVDTGKALAIYQIVAYLVYVIAAILMLQSINVDITLFLAGSTALLIGIGLGVQDVFRDIVAGFVILTERTVTVGDVVEVAGMVSQVKEIHLRTTTVYTRDDIVVIIPNTKLVREQVVNWSQNRLPTRFHIEVRVNYTSDARLVEKALLRSVSDNKEIVKIPAPSVMLRDLSENYMVFHIYFFSRNLFRIERLKSDIRFEIERIFREENIKFAFPKREIFLHPSDMPKKTNT